MYTTVLLSVENDCFYVKTYRFDEPSEFIVGRALGCDLEVPNDEEYREVSQNHCAFHLNPPHIWIRDLESKDGTFVNELKISSEVGNFRLYDQDAVQIGPIRMTVRILEQEASISKQSFSLVHSG